jgi:structural maintenance of chromosome 2
LLNLLQLLHLQIPYQVEVVRGCVDNDSIGALLCRRAEQLDAAVLLMAKHNRGPVKEFFIGRWGGAEGLGWGWRA